MSKIEVDAIDKQSGSTLTLGGSGTAVTLACGATQSGFGRTGTVDWDTTPKTATFTAVSGDGFFANTTGGAFNMNLPAGSAGAIVSVADYAGTWQNNALTVVPNGSDKIGGISSNVTLSTEGQSVTFIFVDSTQGWINVQDSTSNERGATFISASGGTESTDGNYKIHKFTGPGTFTVSSISGTPANNVVDYLVVGAGAGGGAGSPNWTQGGGGGAGGYRTFVSNPTTSPKNAPAGITVTATSFPITVGGGGAGGTPPCAAGGGSAGNVSTFSTVTSAGGGGGGAYSLPNCQGASAGASGGGGGNACTPPGTAGGAGNTPPVSPPQGNAGGAANRAFAGPSSSTNMAGGGGGANAVGADGTGSGPVTPTAKGGNGGAGEPNYITGSNVTYAGGGGGGGAGVCSSGNPGYGGGGLGGAGGGGNGVTAGRTLNCIPWSPTSTGEAGTANTGGGGGGGGAVGDSVTPEFGIGGGTGGSGVVIIRYKYQ
jgi:hypothetical protein